MLIFFLSKPRPPTSTLFPYTTLFRSRRAGADALGAPGIAAGGMDFGAHDARANGVEDRKSTRLNSSHQIISYAVFCLKKKKISVRNPARKLGRLSRRCLASSTSGGKR